MTGGEAPPPSPPERRGWRTHPLARRLPALVLVALGLWLWRMTDTPPREVVWQVEGAGWSEARAIDFQVMGPEGKLVEREERFFGPTGPPAEFTTKWELPEGTYRLLLFVKLEGREARTPVVETLTVGAEEYIVRRPRLPPTR